MTYEGHTREDVPFDDWLAECDTWWDMTCGDEAYDYPWFPWREWYDAGLTVEEACRRANARLYGGDPG